MLPKALLRVDWGPCLWKPLLTPLKTVHQRQSFSKRSDRKLPPTCWKVEELIRGQEKFSDCKLDRLLGAPSALMFPLFCPKTGPQIPGLSDSLLQAPPPPLPLSLHCHDQKGFRGRARPSPNTISPETLPGPVLVRTSVTALLCSRTLPFLQTQFVLKEVTSHLKKVTCESTI